ncbi:MAG: QueT transporter family protein [Oscillospiraceae bacterium]|nr:QueT transporter family protein [Oscillospiraceae bacterium]
MKTKLNIRQITFAALVGALYVTLCYFSNIFGCTFGVFQFRFAEALTVLPFLCPTAAWGLFAGCILANLLSPYGLPDLIFGSLATLVAGLLTARCGSKWLAPLPPVICNGLIVGALLAWSETGFTAAFPGAFAFNALSVGVAELVVCYVLGLPLLEVLSRSRILPQRLAE